VAKSMRLHSSYIYLQHLPSHQPQSTPPQMREIDQISTASIDAEEFFNKYVNMRKPCQFLDQFRTGWGLDKWTNQYLKSQCQSEVKIEYRDTPSDRFGKGNEIQMSFDKFVQEIESGNELYYMTTQKLDYSAEGQASILSPPMNSLHEDFPVNPPIMGNLIVQNINMWMGASARSVTSGLVSAMKERCSVYRLYIIYALPFEILSFHLCYNYQFFSIMTIMTTCTSY
jgi:hypothetical protein